jgi:GNAT superfamily N-acetyltransferase
MAWFVASYVCVRAGSVVEIAAVVALAEEYGAWAVNVAKSEYGIDAQAESEQGLSTSIDELLQPRGRLYLAEIDGAPVGLGGLKPASEEIAEIKRMYVRPSARGRGVGRKLLDRLLDDAREVGFRLVRLESATFMREAQALYRSVGFELVGPYEGREFAAIAVAEEIQVFMALVLAGDRGHRQEPRGT